MFSKHWHAGKTSDPSERPGGPYDLSYEAAKGVLLHGTFKTLANRVGRQRVADDLEGFAGGIEGLSQLGVPLGGVQVKRCVTVAAAFGHFLNVQGGDLTRKLRVSDAELQMRMYVDALALHVEIDLCGQGIQTRLQFVTKTPELTRHVPAADFAEGREGRAGRSYRSSKCSR